MFLKYFLFIVIFYSTTLKACEKPSMPSEASWNNWLQEVREEALDIDATIDLLVKLGDLAENDKILSIDLNPLILVNGIPIAVDALVEIKEESV